MSGRLVYFRKKMKFIIFTLLFAIILVPAPAFAIGPGEAAPPFSLQDLNGNAVSLKSLRGRVVCLTFWATWCPSCKEELPDLDVLQRKYAGNGFTVLSVCVESSNALVANFLRKNPVSFSVLLDKESVVSDAFRVSGLPASFLIGKDGMIRHTYSGYDKETFTVIERTIIEMLSK